MGTLTSSGYKSAYTGDQIDAAIQKIIDFDPTAYALTTHKHAATDITSGKFDIARIPTGTTATTVALGNHTHSGLNYISQTYAQLKTLKSGSKLVPGTFYLINDYSTNYNLIILAVSTNEFSKIAYPVGNTDCKYVEYDFDDETKYGIVTTAKGKITKYVDVNGNEVPFDINNSSITVSLTKSSSCVLKPMTATGYTSVANSVVFSSCNNVFVHAGCYKITCDNCENVVIMPGVHDITVNASMNGSIISYNPDTDTVNVIRD